VNRLKPAVAIPIIASLNGTSPQRWLYFGRVIEQAGADALEINTYEVVTDPSLPGAAVDRRLADMVRDLKHVLRIPVAVKLSPFYSAIANVAHMLDAAGADGLALFNRFYQPDIHVRSMQVVPTLDLSTSAELRLRLRWIAILHGRVRPSLDADGRRRPS
jgi:dihydroorotate dehydrogenase (fumarate)